ncbi:MAG TPA: hypothetical protein VH500_13405 [Nitrososphaeraceae archaeon]
MQSYQLRNFREDNKETWRSFGSLDELEQVGLSPDSIATKLGLKDIK